MSLNSIFEVKNVVKVYQDGDKERTALNNVSLEVFSGEMVALMGPSGCGKSTLLKVGGLLTQPTSGKVLLSGEAAPSTQKKRAVLRNEFIGYIHQDLAIVDQISAQANVRIPLEYSIPRPKKREISRRTQDALEQVGMAWSGKRSASKLSGGERQRVSIGRAVINNPSLILADEPTAALDFENAVNVLAIFRQLAQSGAAVIIATHDPRVSDQCDRTVRLLDGSIEVS